MSEKKKYNKAEPPKKAIPDTEIINKVLVALATTTSKLSKQLGYKSPATVANIKTGYHPLSEDMIFRFRNNVPQINEQFLRTGMGSVLSDGTEIDKSGLVTLKDQFTILNLKDVPNRLARIEANQNDLKEMFSEMLSILKK